MLNLREITVDFLTSVPVLVSVALLLLVVLTVLVYRKTNPPLPRTWRTILGVIRLLALLALFAALAEPIVGFSRAYERTRRVALVLDRSSSMDRMEAGKSRRTRMDSLLSSASFNALSSQVRVTPYYFGGNLTRTQQAVDQDKTALGEMLYELERLDMVDPSDYWVLLSDGRWNSGRDPADVARTAPSPIIVVDMAGGGGQFDIALTGIDFNPVVFSGQKTSIEVSLSWQAAQGKGVRVELRDSARVLASDQLSMTQEVGQGGVTLDYLPAEPGQQLLEVSVPPIEGEESVDNNRRSFAVKVLKSRLSILLATRKPDYEVGFLKRFLGQSGKYDVDLKVIGAMAGNLAGRLPPTQTELNRYDLIVLYDPDPVLLEGHRQQLTSYLNERGGALWLLMGEEYAKRGPVPWMNELLPFYQSRRMPIEYREFTAQPAEGQLFHPALRLEENQSSIRRSWSQLPPFQCLVPCDELHSDGVVLATAVRPIDQIGRLPVMGYRRFGPGKLFACAALPFWNWGFVTLGFGEESRYYATFVEGAVSWLTVRDDFDPIRIKPEKEVFARGETVVFGGFAYDLGYRPIPDVTGRVDLAAPGSGESIRSDLVGIGEGRYRAEFFGLPPGKYGYSAVFEKDGRLLKESEGELLVESFSLEEFDQRGDPITLASLARLSGGNYFSADEFDGALDKVERAPVAVVQEHEFALWNQLWLLFVIVGALSVEWFLRKAVQLV